MRSLLILCLIAPIYGQTYIGNLDLEWAAKWVSALDRDQLAMADSIQNEFAAHHVKIAMLEMSLGADEESDEPSYGMFQIYLPTARDLRPDMTDKALEDSLTNYWRFGALLTEELRQRHLKAYSDTERPNFNALAAHHRGQSDFVSGTLYAIRGEARYRVLADIMKGVE